MTFLPAILLLATGYPICTSVESDPGVFVDTECYAAAIYRGRRFCGETEGENPGGLFVEYGKPFRYQLLTDTCSIDEPRDAAGWCLSPRPSGRVDRKEVARNEFGSAFATGLIRQAWLPFSDGMERLDQFNTSACVFSFTGEAP